MSIDREVQDRAQAAFWLVRRMGKLTWDYFEQGVATETKKDLSPVTIADRQAEELFREHVGRAFPRDGFLGEEFGEQPSESGYRWIIDPIDATRNFVAGIPIFANLVALEHRGEIVAGFANVPGLRQCFHAIRGQGAFCNDKPIRVSGLTDLSKSQVGYSSLHWFERSRTTEAFLELSRRSYRTRGLGDFWGYLLVATGSLDAMVEPLISPWDIAPLQVIVEEAGGVFTDWHGKRSIYTGSCIAGNPAIHPQVISHLADYPAPVRPNEVP